MACAIEEILDLGTYPLHQPGSSAYASLVATLRGDWRARGAFRLPMLIRSKMAARAAAELSQPMEMIAFRHRQDHNIYFVDDMDGLPGDIAERRLVTSHRTLTCDQMAGTIIRSVYEWDALREFLQQILALPKLYRMADPMACLNVMAYGDGDELGWHFDRAEFAVTILLQAASAGGQFEYRRGLRTAADENFDG
ncbi:MAG: HalD/BesD family halogenase, partial [Geminicoccaceae bacterium]